MLSRIFSPVLIAAVIACPLSCGHSSCCAKQACAGDDRELQQKCSTIAPVPPASAHCGCCGDSSGKDQNPSRNPGPEKSSCQGVCGGAVFERSCQMDRVDAKSVLSLTGDDTPHGSVMCVVCAVGSGCPELFRQGNHGRFLRTLRMSLTC
ncbi:MAG: hypothetical protein GY826_09470 [Fuerstiella sp.]|nr:hypothetical protein [Fuerstiella sp.]